MLKQLHLLPPQSPGPPSPPVPSATNPLVHTHTPLRQHRASWDMAPSNQLASSSAHRLWLGAAALIWRSWDWFWCSAWNVRSLKWILWMSEWRNVAKCLTRDVPTHLNADVTPQSRAGFSLQSRFLFQSSFRGIMESTRQTNKQLKLDMTGNVIQSMNWGELTHMWING